LSNCEYAGGGGRLHPPGQTKPAGVLVVAPASLLHPCVPQPGATLLYELVTGHPDRAPHELVTEGSRTKWSRSSRVA
jgi:hypothetical protein